MYAIRSYYDIHPCPLEADQQPEKEDDVCRDLRKRILLPGLEGGAYEDPVFHEATGHLGNHPEEEEEHEGLDA